MIKKSITAIIVILVILAAALVFDNYTNNNNFTDNNSNPEQQISTTSISNNANATNNKSASNAAKSQMKISSEEAKKIAQTHIEGPELTAGTPVLTTKKDGAIYIIPIINTKNSASTGYIAINAQTGEFMDTGTP